MKKLTPLFFCLAFFNAGYSQTCDYNPFPDIESYWVGEHISSSSGGTYTYRGMKWHGDTTISSAQYTKVYHHDLTGSPTLYDYQYFGGIRQDIPNEKVYYLDLNDVEHDVSINQNAQIGDTVLITSEMYDIFMFGYSAGASIDTFVVAQIDSIIDGASCRKNFIYNSVSSNFSSLSYWSGIGLSHPYALNFGYSIYCFHHGAEKIIGSGFNPICEFVSVPEKGKSSLKTYPNPAANNLVISGVQASGTLTIYNQLGQEVMSVKLDKGDSNVDVSILEIGTYMAILTSEQSTQYGKVIIRR